MFSAEMFAIGRALNYILISGDDLDYSVFTDSLSSVEALKKHSIAQQDSNIHCVMNLVKKINEHRTRVRVEWISSHRGIAGNELTDREANKALQLPYITLTNISKPDGKRKIKLAVQRAWQKKWSQQTTVGRHMASIKQAVESLPWAYIPNNRILETVMARLRIGHCGLNAHLYKFGLHHTPFCECGLPETISHCLIDCEMYRQPRLRLRNLLGQHRLSFVLKNLLGGATCKAELQHRILVVLVQFLTVVGKLGTI